MWQKAKTKGSELINTIGSAVGLINDADDEVWKHRFERKFKTGECGITMLTTFPEKLMPAALQSDMVVFNVIDALSLISLADGNENSEELLRSSTTGLIEDDFDLLQEESFVNCKASLENSNAVSFEDFLHNELPEDDAFFETLELLKDLDDSELDVNVLDTVEDDNNPGFVSTTDVKESLPKWTGHRESLLSSENTVMGSGSPEVPESTMNTKVEEHSELELTEISNTDIQEFKSTSEISEVQSVSGVEKENVQSATSSKDLNPKKSTDQSSNNSGKRGNFKRLCNKVSPTPDDSNNNAIKSKNSKFVAVQNIAYQQPGTSTDSFQNDIINKTRRRNKDDVQLFKDSSELKGIEGYKQYKLFAKAEKAVNLTRLEKTRKKILDKYNWNKSTIDEVMEVARRYYSDPLGPARKRWKDLRREIDQHSRHSMTDTRVKLSALRQFIPFFTYGIMALQTLLLVIMLISGGVVTVDVGSSLQLQEDTRTFLGRETVDRREEVNMWLGPPIATLAGFGGIVATCMRDDHNVYMSGVTHNYSTTTPLGCCEVEARNTAATTTQHECDTLTLGVGNWRENLTCSERHDNATVEHVIKPCCLPSVGTCAMLSPEHCYFLDGKVEFILEHCSLVNCVGQACGGMSQIFPKADKPWLPSENSYQWWRPLVSLFYTHGIIHLLLILAGEWLLLRQVEKTAGWLRVAVIYIVCGVTGGICASSYSPYIPQVCSTASVMAFLGVVHMELIEGWKLIKKPAMELIKIYCLLMFAMFTGTFPLISNAAIIIGFVKGNLAAVAFLPYINLTLTLKLHRRVAMVVAIILMLTVAFFVIYSFHHIQSLFMCKWCRALDCAKYSEDMCTFEDDLIR